MAKVYNNKKDFEKSLREQKAPATIRVWTLIKGILVVFALIGAYIFGSQTAIQGENRYNQDVVTQAQNLVKQLK